MNFLPITKQEMLERGIEQPDFVYVIGDAYVDHPSFGPAIISRLLESRGYSVCMLPQPDWKRKESVREFGEPRLGFLVSAGNMDSMVNHYTVGKKDGIQMRILPVAYPACVRTGQWWSIVILYARRIKKLPSFLGGWKPPSGEWPTTITGLTR